MPDTSAQDQLEGEGLTLFHILRVTKRREERTIPHVQNTGGTIRKSHKDILQVFIQHLQNKYEFINVDDSSIKVMLEVIHPPSQLTYADHLHRQISMDEIQSALRTGGKNKAPGSDGICIEFYTAHRDTTKLDLHEVINQMFMQCTVTPQQKHGIIVCLPKHTGAQTPEEYRPITLLNTDYKILARIMANRLRPVLEDHLRSTQLCSVPGNTILEAVSTIREAMAHAETTGAPLCVLNLDFQNAFDRISHKYLFQ
jgi:hypothetical protein